MLGEFKRDGRSGNIVTFRLEGTMEFLWKGPMLSIPSEDFEVGLLVNSEVETWYKVEKVRCEFAYEVYQVGGGEDPEVPVVSDYARNAYTVIVSLVP